MGLEAQVLRSHRWWDVPVPEVSVMPAVAEARSDYEKSLAEERWFV